MQKRKLGNSELHLSEVGFGAWAIGGGDWSFGWGPQDDNESIAAIKRALELGVNWIDTAAVYGLGHSEEIVAEAIKGMRNRLIIATKCSMVWDDKGKISSSLKAASVRSECEASLKRLGTDRIDLYQVHWPNDDKHIEEGWSVIGQLIEEGKVRYGGVSNFYVPHLDRAHNIHPIASLQPPYSMLRRAVEDGVFEYCRRNGIGVVTYSPMQAGLLTGAFDIDRLAENDWRRGSKEFNEPNLSINLDFVEKLHPIAEKYGKTVAQLAIAWVLRLDVVTSAIVGARRPSQIEETVGGSDWNIEQEDLDSIDELLNERNKRIEEAFTAEREKSERNEN